MLAMRCDLSFAGSHQLSRACCCLTALPSLSALPLRLPPAVINSNAANHLAIYNEYAAWGEWMRCRGALDWQGGCRSYATVS